MTDALQIEGVSKRFGNIQALSNVGFSVARGEVCAVMGENGAGKSTLMNILSGSFPSDSGRVRVNGHDVSFRSPLESQRSGIGIVHQELNLVDTLSVLENLFIGRMPHKNGVVDWAGMRAQAKGMLDLVGAGNLALHERVDHLSIGQQQLVEIARVLSMDPAILILDEPTSSLSERDSVRLLGLVRDLKARQHTILYISHRMHEVLALADTIVVMRDGRFIAKVARADATEDSIAEAMVGRQINRITRAAHDGTGERVLELRNVATNEGIRNVSFAVHAGEIVGLAGLVGSGRTEVAHAIFGAATVTEGTILFDGEPVTFRSPRDALARGICLVPEDRKTEGLNLSASIRENMMMSFRHVVSTSPVLQKAKERSIVARFLAKFGIAAPHAGVAVGTLSGGNQQKVVLARGFAIKPRLIVFDEPTRGVDVAAKAEIHKLIIEAAAAGAAIVLISSELPELLAIADRIAVMAQRQLRVDLPRSASEAEVMMHAIAA